MKSIFSFSLKEKSTKFGVILFLLCAGFIFTGCSSDDDGTPQEEMAEEEEANLDFELLVASWEASSFTFLNSNSSLPDTEVLGQGGSAILEVMDDGTFLFTIRVIPEEPEIMNEGVFRVQDNTLQARFESQTDYRNLEAEIEEMRLSIEGQGLFDLSGNESNVPIGFRATFFRR